MRFSDPLPIDDVLETLVESLAHKNRAVLIAPPGAGKTTRVPLALLDQTWSKGKRILVLEPRRLAARAAAQRLAEQVGGQVGGTVGLRIRLESRIGPQTRIEVITEGIFTRMILDDPELSDVAAILFDEFHERSLDADLGLALALDVQNTLNPALRLLVMSATLDGGRVSQLLHDADVIQSEGRSFPVTTRYRPRDPQHSVEDAVFSTLLEAVQQDQGSVLVFLPGQAEILRLARRLAAEKRLSEFLIAPLYGNLDPHMQDQAIKPCGQGRRKLVLATAIAETSLTIEDVRIVIDSGLSRVPHYEPDLGLTRLKTVRVSRASADQRRGRAGRVQAGIAYRLWAEAADGALEPFHKPEILTSDLSAFLLDCAVWGEYQPQRLGFLDPPPEPALKEAQALLKDLGAFGADGRLTDLGKAIRAFGLPPRLASMIVQAHFYGQAEQAAWLAAVLSERGFGGDESDLSQRVEKAQRDQSPRGKILKRLVADWVKTAQRHATPVLPKGSDLTAQPLSLGGLLLFAYPERLAKARQSGGAYLLANGRAAHLPEGSALGASVWLVVAELSGQAQAARLLSAVPISQSEVETHPFLHVATEQNLSFDRQARALRHREKKTVGAITLSERMLPIAAQHEAASCLAAGLVSLGLASLPWTKSLQFYCARNEFLRSIDATWPDFSEAGLLQDGMSWLVPYLYGLTAVADLTSGQLEQALVNRLDHRQKKKLDLEAPPVFVAPTGQSHAIDYGGADGPVLAIRVQELFGLKEHPSLAGGKIPLTLHMLSPAHRPIQITRDLPGFWKGSWAAVKSDMKGRYPKHVWPDDPANTAPTTRAKPRGS